jgi:hypothetical protein
MADLGGVCALVRSDQLAIDLNGEEKPAMDEATIPATGGGARFEPGAYWIDCFL